MKKCEGFTFAEVMFALVIFTITIASTVPLFLFVIKEKQTINEQLIAYEILHNTFEEIRVSNKHIIEQQITKMGTTFEIKMNQTEKDIQICVQWTGKNDREYNECGVLTWIPS